MLCVLHRSAVTLENESFKLNFGIICHIETIVLVSYA